MVATAFGVDCDRFCGDMVEPLGQHVMAAFPWTEAVAGLLTGLSRGWCARLRTIEVCAWDLYGVGFVGWVIGFVPAHDRVCGYLDLSVLNGWGVLG